jgi:hypothetical protein
VEEEEDEEELLARATWGSASMTLGSYRGRSREVTTLRREEKKAVRRVTLMSA